VNLGKIEIPSADGKIHAPLATLDELISEFSGKDYIFDCKEDDEGLFLELWRLVGKYGPRGRIWFLTWSRLADRHIKEYFPDFLVFPREGRTRIWGYASLLGLGRVLEPDNEILSLPVRYYGLPVVSKRQIASIQSRGKSFLSFLANTDEDIRRTLEFGIRHIITDRPDLVSKMVRTKI